MEWFFRSPFSFVAYFNYKTLEVVLREGFGFHP
jgi:hypothetical protein